MFVSLIRPVGIWGIVYESRGKIGQAVESGIDIRHCSLQSHICLRNLLLSRHEGLDNGVQSGEYASALFKPQVQLADHVFQCWRYALFSTRMARRDNAFSIR